MDVSLVWLERGTKDCFFSGNLKSIFIQTNRV